MSLDDDLFEDDEVAPRRGGPDLADAPSLKGLTEAEPRILKWLNDIVDDPDFQSAIPLTLVRINAHDQEEAVFDLKHDLDKPTPETVKEILDAAANSANRVFSSGLERADFSVKVDGNRQRLAFSFYTSNPPSLALRNVGRQTSQYAPDLEGLTSQNMDIQVELIDRIVDLSTANLTDKDRTIAMLREELRISRSIEWKLRGELEKMMDGSVRRSMMIDEFNRDQKRKDMYAEAFMNIAPPVVATVLGPEAGKAAALLASLTNSPDGQGLAKLFGGGLGGQQGPGGDDDVGEPASDLSPETQQTLDHVDAFIEILEKRKGLFQKLLQVLAPSAPECVAHLQAIHSGSMTRRMARARGPK